jgi:hypothetical protein
MSLIILNTTMVVVYTLSHCEEVEVALTEADLEESSEAKDDLSQLSSIWIEDAARQKLQQQLHRLNTPCMVTALLHHDEVAADPVLVKVTAHVTIRGYTESYELELTLSDMASELYKVTHETLTDEVIRNVATDILFARTLDIHDANKVKITFEWEVVAEFEETYAKN